MRVGLVVQALERTPPVRSGAVERTVWYLAERLVGPRPQGTPFARGGSRPRDRRLGVLASMARDKRPGPRSRAGVAGGLPIRLAGKVLDQDYFGHAVRPLLRHPDVEYLGELVGGEKRELLGRAHALVHPSEYEACSNVIIEAMGSGAPVVCLDRSSNAELVQHGVTGFVCGSPNELVDACRRAGEIARGAGRRRYLDPFTFDRMVDGYLAAYERLLAG